MKKIILITLFLISNISHADNVADSTARVCQKVKQCGVAQLEQQGLQSEMIDMMKSMFDGMCDSMVAPYVRQANDAGLEKKALACLETIEALSCKQLMNGAGNETKECKELEKAADEAGISKQ